MIHDVYMYRCIHVLDIHIKGTMLILLFWLVSPEVRIEKWRERYCALSIRLN